ncbi:MAG: hypothetical protein SH868_06240 [Bythopirellula sp.]|nr:hypothetical protein [Bythopirellula sp.]
MVKPLKALDWKKASRCCLCGEGFVDKPMEKNEKRDRQHVPPKQFFPKQTRETEKLNLWTAAAHNGCNGGLKNDEEYFYHALAIQVTTGNPAFADVIFQDIRRRAAKPHTRSIIKALLKNAGPITPGGIHLPTDMIQWQIDGQRVNRVVVAIAQALSCYHDDQFLNSRSCVIFQFCREQDKVPQVFNVLMQNLPSISDCPSVFAYWRYDLNKKGLKIYSLLFWEAFLFCLAFDTQSQGAPDQNMASLTE